MGHRNVAAADVTDVAAPQSVQDGRRIKRIVAQSESLTTRSRNRDDEKGQFGWPIGAARSQTGAPNQSQREFASQIRHTAPDSTFGTETSGPLTAGPAKFPHSTSRCTSGIKVNGAVVIRTLIDTR